MRLYGPLNDFLKGARVELRVEPGPYATARSGCRSSRARPRRSSRKDDHHAIEFSPTAAWPRSSGDGTRGGLPVHAEAEAGDPTPAASNPPRERGTAGNDGQTPVVARQGAELTSSATTCGWWTRPRRRCASQRCAIPTPAAVRGPDVRITPARRQVQQSGPAASGARPCDRRPQLPGARGVSRATAPTRAPVASRAAAASRKLHELLNSDRAEIREARCQPTTSHKRAIKLLGLQARGLDSPISSRPASCRRGSSIVVGGCARKAWPRTQLPTLLSGRASRRRSDRDGSAPTYPRGSMPRSRSSPTAARRGDHRATHTRGPTRLPRSAGASRRPLETRGRRRNSERAAPCKRGPEIPRPHDLAGSVRVRQINLVRTNVYGEDSQWPAARMPAKQGDASALRRSSGSPPAAPNIPAAATTSARSSPQPARGHEPTRKQIRAWWAAGRTRWCASHGKQRGFQLAVVDVDPDVRGNETLDGARARAGPAAARPGRADPTRRHARVPRCPTASWSRPSQASRRAGPGVDVRGCRADGSSPATLRPRPRRGPTGGGTRAGSGRGRIRPARRLPGRMPPCRGSSGWRSIAASASTGAVASSARLARSSATQWHEAGNAALNRRSATRQHPARRAALPAATAARLGATSRGIEAELSTLKARSRAAAVPDGRSGAQRRRAAEGASTIGLPGIEELEVARAKDTGRRRCR